MKKNFFAILTTLSIISSSVQLMAQTPYINMGSTLSDTKIALYNDGNAIYGLGIQPFQFRLHIDSYNSRFTFYDSPTNGNELVNIYGNGKVSIGYNKKNAANFLAEAPYKLYVKGGIRTETVRTDLNGVWPDYVFDSGYSLPSIESLESFIAKNHHLPEVPSAREVEEKGINLPEMDAALLRKIEELTLYMIELKKENDQLKSRMSSFEQKK